ncbi:hypothetical protein CEXT_331181 [Caerostris extrusa]|uniref:Uncharacterized protein n=1 Tax=Caerostris extrusa TaxID=172846 RepID=A0AAV4QKJ3_CAEEX|nr:hypothetical protein CEXT_331181 [Caerostris extrusa]
MEGRALQTPFKEVVTRPTQDTKSANLPGCSTSFSSSLFCKSKTSFQSGVNVRINSQGISNDIRNIFFNKFDRCLRKCEIYIKIDDLREAVPSEYAKDCSL